MYILYLPAFVWLDLIISLLIWNAKLNIQFERLHLNPFATVHFHPCRTMNPSVIFVILSSFLYFFYQVFIFVGILMFFPKSSSFNHFWYYLHHTKNLWCWNRHLWYCGVRRTVARCKAKNWEFNPGSQRNFFCATVIEVLVCGIVVLGPP